MIEKDIEYISKNLSKEAIYDQLTEECCELGHASAKMARIRRCENPTPIQGGEALKNLEEEFTDIIVCALVLGLAPNETLMERKLVRWKNRIKDNKKEW